MMSTKDYVRFALRSVLLTVSMVLSLVSCGGDSDPELPVEVPRVEGMPSDSTVVGWYNLFIEGKYTEYVRLAASNDGMPASYCRQMEMLMRQRHLQQEQQHDGPKKCRVLRFDDYTEDYCNAYIEVTFKDGVKEQILIPLVKVEEQWRIR